MLWRLKCNSLSLAAAMVDTAALEHTQCCVIIFVGTVLPSISVGSNDLAGVDADLAQMGDHRFRNQGACGSTTPVWFTHQLVKYSL